MRVVLLCESFPKDMGYLNTVLPKYLARQGAEVHVVALDLPPYYRAADWQGPPPSFVVAQALHAGSTLQLDGFTVHILAHGFVGRFAYAKALHRCLSGIRPDIVYTTAAIGPLPLQAALSLPRLGYKLFTGNHTSAEAFALARNEQPTHRQRLQAFATRWLPGRIVSLVTERCYCRTDGCGEIATRFFGVQAHKISVIPLGVDTERFFPAATPETRARRDQLRRELGFEPHELVCINTGRMIASKDLSLLIAAIGALRSQGIPLRALFIGDGPERARLARAEHCVLLPFCPWKQLADYYRAADIAVWPAGESISMFDAAASGLPLIVSDRIDAHLDGNGIAFREHDVADLCEALARLADADTRKRMGEIGATTMRDRQSWTRAAEQRMRDFQRALRAPTR